jgi:hypothetical protein
VPCRAVPCRAVPCRAVPCRAVPCRAVPCRAVPCRLALCPLCCRCPSCAADQRELLAAEAAALQRQLSAPAAELRAAAAAVEQEHTGGVAAMRPHTHHMHTQAQLLPALSVVNHATGQHIVISGFDKVGLMSHDQPAC